MLKSSFPFFTGNGKESILNNFVLYDKGLEVWFRFGDFWLFLFLAGCFKEIAAI